MNVPAFLVELFTAHIRYSSMSLTYHVGNGVFGGACRSSQRFWRGCFPAFPLVGLLYPMTVAAIGVVVSTLGLKRETHQVQIWDEAGGAQPPRRNGGNPERVRKPVR